MSRDCSPRRVSFAARWLLLAGGLFLGIDGAAAQAAAPIGQTVWLRAAANGRYVSADVNLAGALVANRTGVGGWETFVVIDAGAPYVALRANANGRYVAADLNKAGALVADRTAVGDWERFEWQSVTGGIALRARANGRYVAADLNRGVNAPLYADRTGVSGWETFTWGNTSSPTPTPPPSSSGFKQIGYMPSWSGSVSSVQYQYLTHINYAFALPNSSGTLQAIPDPSKLSSLVSTAHSRGVKVLLSIGGWNGGNDSAFETFAASSTGRTTFVNSCVNVLNQYGLDGIDIDWEYPDPGSSGTNYQNLMSQLCSAMHSRGKLCTAAVVAQGSTGGGVTNTVFGYVDYLMIMAYDANNGDHSSYAYAQSSLSYWRNRGLPASKAVLGVPFYARPSWAAYSALLAAGCSSTANSCWYQGTTNWYNGTTLIGQKRQLALSNGGGLMNWELSQDVNDTRSLLRAMSGGVPLR